jgi:hypothetical protein
MRFKYRLNIFVEGFPSDDRDLKETFGKVDDKSQVYAFLKRIVVALIPIDRKAGESHVSLDYGS